MMRELIAHHWWKLLFSKLFLKLHFWKIFLTFFPVCCCKTKWGYCQMCVDKYDIIILTVFYHVHILKCVSSTYRKYYANTVAGKEITTILLH